MYVPSIEESETAKQLMAPGAVSPGLGQDSCQYRQSDHWCTLTGTSGHGPHYHWRGPSPWNKCFHFVDVVKGFDAVAAQLLVVNGLCRSLY